MTDCPNGEMRDLLPDLLHGRLGAAERAEVEAHLRDCAECRGELALLRSMRGALHGAPPVDVDGIVAAIRPYRAPAQRRPLHSWSGWRVAAAVTLLAVGGTSVVLARHTTTGRVDGAQVASAKHFDSLTGHARDDVQVVPSSTTSASPANELPSSPRELALAGSTISELDDSELSALIADIGSIDAVTPADVDNAATVGPIAPTSPSGTNN